MFGDFARSAEAVFSRWAIKRICKFLLKKKLGDLILGDIDLDQLDVQLGQGTIQLSDLALNVDYLNQKLAGATVIVKEGSIGSLSMKIPWKLKNCQIEVEELELVLAPNVENEMPRDADCSKASDDDEQRVSVDADKLRGTIHDSPPYAPTDIHEGVKTIAKIVKWFLTSFHVRLKNLIIAYDPSPSVEGKKSASYRSLVLRISEVEYGTCISEDNSMPDSKLDCLLGVGKLTNFIKFQGAVVEFLQMDNIDSESQVHGDLNTSFSEWYAGSSPSCCMATILTGSGGGFSGKMNVSIPWKNGSVDIYKVDADISIDPVELSIQQDTIMWMITLWESLKNVNKAGEGHIPRKALESSSLNSGYHSQLDSTSYPVLTSHKATPGRGSFSRDSCSTSTQDSIPDGFLPCANVIQNWVPLSVPQEMQVGLEADYGASIYQFFECFDEIRSSQASLGNSGILNWTCSVFSAITAASNLASGSVHVPTDQCHVETNIQASLGEISVIVSFLPEEREHSQNSPCGLNHVNDSHGIGCGSLSTSDMVDSLENVPSADSFMSCLSTMNVDQSSIMEINGANPDVHHLDARFQNITLKLQIHHQKMNLEASVRHAKVDMFYDSGSISRGFEVFNHKSNSGGQTPLSQSLQLQVQGALPPFPRHYGRKEAAVNANTRSEKGMIKVVLFESFGACHCQYTARPSYLDGRVISSASFIINLPPFLLWVHLQLVDVLLNFFKEVQISLERNCPSKDAISDILDKRNGFSLDEAKTGVSNCITALPQNANTQGNILLPHARVVLCFPTVNHGERKRSTSWGKFVVFEFSTSPDVGKVPDASGVPKANSSKGDFSAPSTSIHVNIGSIDGYLVTPQCEKALNEEGYSLNRLFFSAKKIFSIKTGANDHRSGIYMLCQKGPVTGPWMVNRTWGVATSHDQTCRNKVTGNEYKFSSVKTAVDLREKNSLIRQELVLNSALCLQVYFSQVWINLGRNDYELLNDLLSDLMDGLPGKTDGIDINGSFENSQIDSSPTQLSILVECDMLDLCINLDSIEIGCSIQKELQGSWNSLRLTVQDFELLSVSNIGGVADANILWLKHGEGELWGSIVDRQQKSTQDLLLISCSNSTKKRGDGEGTNALSFGSAGTTITHIKNPTTHQIFTSITLQCGTFVAPGGRLDWISALSYFFTLPPQGPELDVGDTSRSRSDGDDVVYISSFFLELVDIALSFEPYKFDHIDLKMKNGEAVQPVEESCEKHVACLLAAASLNVSHHSMADTSTNEHKFQLQDVGLLIGESSGSKHNRCDYSIDYLRKSGYVKVAHETLVAAVLRIRGVTWEIECQEAHINLDTCSDSTDGLCCLVSQLQQLYAPDLEDALVHLQSRWNTVQQKNSKMIDEADISDRLSVKLSSENNLSNSSEDVRSIGLLDEILENAFFMDLEQGSAFDSCDSHRLNMHFPGDGNGLNSSNGIAGDTSSPNISHGVPVLRSELRPHIIDSYYASDFVAPSKISALDRLHREDLKHKHCNTGNKDVECGKGRWFKDGSLRIVENHLSEIINQPSGEKQHEEANFDSVCSVAVDNCRTRGRILLKNIDVTWRIYAGSDWSKPRENLLSGLSSNGRDGTVCLEVKLSGLNLQYDVYPDEEVCASKLAVSVQDFHLYDRSKDAPWKMVLGYYHSKDHPRESCAKAFKLDLEVVKPDPMTPLEEYRLHLEFLPIRLHLDQSQLNFLINFFGKGADRINSQPNDLEKSQIPGKKVNYGTKTIVEEALLPFFQKCDVMPVVVRVDYIPRRVDLGALRGGNYAELLNLVPWKGIDLQLKHVDAVGVYGWNSVCETVVGQWLEDISHNQVHKLLKGLPPIKSLYAVGSGASKLVSLPIKSYKKDHKLLKGMQRGAIAFIRSISLEAVGLGVHLAAGAHEVFLQTEYILTSIPPSMPSLERDQREMTFRSNQPKDAQQGIQRAYESISDGLGRSASVLVGTPFKTYQRGGGAGPALATAVRAAPAAVMAPVSASARAVHCALVGVRNSLDPEHKKESMEKYLGHQP